MSADNGDESLVIITYLSPFFLFSFPLSFYSRVYNVLFPINSAQFIYNYLFIDSFFDYLSIFILNSLGYENMFQYKYSVLPLLLFSFHFYICCNIFMVVLFSFFFDVASKI